MVSIDLKKCVWCGWCVHFCPQGAIKSIWGIEVDPEKCTDCFDGMHHFNDNQAVGNGQQLLDRHKNSWRRLCVENCSNDAIVVHEE